MFFCCKKRNCLTVVRLIFFKQTKIFFMVHKHLTVMHQNNRLKQWFGFITSRIKCQGYSTLEIVNSKGLQKKTFRNHRISPYWILSLIYSTWHFICRKVMQACCTLLSCSPASLCAEAARHHDRQWFSLYLKSR